MSETEPEQPDEATEPQVHIFDDKGAPTKFLNPPVVVAEDDGIPSEREP